MPLEKHPTDPDKLVMRANQYNLPRAWKNLTQDELDDIYAMHHDGGGNQVSPGFAYELSIQAALRAKNEWVPG